MISVKLPCIVLAGGLGTRLATVVNDRPKPMAMIRDKPFLEHLLNWVINSGVVSRVILSVGYRHEFIVDYFGNFFQNIPIDYSVEESPLGTGGAVYQALSTVCEEHVLLLNGDTIFSVDLKDLVGKHLEYMSDVTIALKPMKNFDRYGSVICENGIVTGFTEKVRTDEGLINGGVYVLKKSALSNRNFSKTFSFERDFLAALVDKLDISGIPYDGYFIDIGIPEDYRRAQTDLAQ